jgi:hypothetical protein
MCMFCELGVRKWEMEGVRCSIGAVRWEIGGGRCGSGLQGWRVRFSASEVTFDFSLLFCSFVVSQMLFALLWLCLLSFPFPFLYFLLMNHISICSYFHTFKIHHASHITHRSPPMNSVGSFRTIFIEWQDL